MSAALTARAKDEEKDDGPAVADFFPSSVEEAGALLGMAITQLTLNNDKILAPPVGMHSSFRVTRPSHSNLLSRLYQLRALLRSDTQPDPLVSAPSLLAVLLKMIGVSTHLAPAYTSHAAAGTPAAGTGDATLSPSSAAARRPVTPPLLSHAIRHVWVDCVTLCHVRGAGLTGTARIDTSKFLRNMLALASQNPRAARAAGGVRIAALEAVAGLLHAHSPKLQTAPWALDVLQICLKALRSAGNGEPTYRQTAVQTAIAVTVASRKAQMLRQEQFGETAGGMVLPGALEDKALVEAVKLLKQATQDKLPEIRCAAAQFACHLAPLLFGNAGRGGAGSAAEAALVEDVLHVAWRQLDDEASAYMVQTWAEAVARILTAVLCFHDSYDKSVAAGSASAKGSEGGGTSASSSGAIRASARDDGVGSGEDGGGPARRSTTIRGTGGRITLYSQATMSLQRTLQYLVDQFVKVGGELVAARMGGSYSSGGRAVRVGIGAVVSHLLQLRTAMGPDIGTHLTLGEYTKLVLQMVGGPEMEKQLRPPDGHGATNTLASFGGTSRNWSKADAGVARAIVNRVIRDGLAQNASEATQLALFQELVNLLPNSNTQVTHQDFPVHLNPHQIQCVLVELSHLIATLGQGITAKIPELLPVLQPCFKYHDWGVRHEAAVTCQSLSLVHPDTGRELVKTALSDLQMHHAQLMTLSPSSSAAADAQHARNKQSISMFRRSVKDTVVPKTDAAETLPHQYAVHGLSTMVAMLVREMPHSSGGLPAELAGTIASVGEVLVASQFNEILVKSSSESAACTCVRAGYMLISGIMATGPKGVVKHVPWVFKAWQKASNSAKSGGSKILAANHDLVCIDAVLYSVVVFLKYCSELLLTVPQALTHITVLLEDLLPILLSDGRLGGMPLTPHISTRLESARASLLEAFAWLPAGSYPMAADLVFAFAAENIQAAVYSEIACSILPELLSKEDSVLDTCSLARIKREGQSGAALQIEQTVLLLTAEFSHPVEREAVLHLQDRKKIQYLDGTGESFRQSYILGSRCGKRNGYKPPTPLHEVGMWRRPMDPSSSAKIRLVDAAIQAFAATFGLKSGKEQQSAMHMLEALVPQYFAQITRTLNSSLTSEQSKLKDDSAPAVSNITAVLLLCLQSLPIHESTHNVPIGLGPPWMNKAKDILLTVLPSASNAVRRAAAECLALLATLGVTEDAHFLQSTVLHSLDEVRQGNKPDGKPRTIALEPVSAARAGSLLTLACMQRTANHVAQRQLERARGRASDGTKSSGQAQNKESELPLLQMMTRILPSIADYGFTDFFEVRTFALQSFQILLAYSSRLDKPLLDNVDKQLLRKTVEIVEDNVCSAWIVASSDLDRGHESEKMASECAFLAVVLRLISFLTTYLKILRAEDDTILCRFCVMVRMILERNGSHPSIAYEGMVFYEIMANQKKLLPPLSENVSASEAPLYSMIPPLLTLLTPARPHEYAKGNLVLFSYKSLRPSVFLLQALSRASLPLIDKEGGKILGLIIAALESVAGRKQFLGTGLLRSMVVSRRAEAMLTENEEVVGELAKVMAPLVLHQPPQPEKNYPLLLRCLLFARGVLSGVGTVEESPNDVIVYNKEHVVQSALLLAKRDVEEIYKVTSSPRWQSKTIAAQLAAACLGEMLLLEHHRLGTPSSNSHHFDISLAGKWCKKQCKEAKALHEGLPSSLLAFHLQELVASSCMSSVASLDQSELFAVQESSLHFLSHVIQAFSQIPDPDMPGSDLLHQYSQQIYSVVKHSLSSSDEVQTEASFRVLLSGCETLSVIVKEKMSTDSAVLKRLVRPIVPLQNQLKFGPIAERKPDPPFRGSSYSNLIKVAKIIFTGDLLFGGESNVTLDSISEELVSDRAAFGVECGLVALEGVRLLMARNFSLTGRPGDGQKGALSADDYHSDLTAIKLLSSSWPSCVRAATKALCLAIKDESTEEFIKKECFIWLKTLGTVVLEGCEDGTRAIASAGQPLGGFTMDAELVLVECLRSLSLLMRACDILPPDTLNLEAVGRVANVLQKKIVEPLLCTYSPNIKKPTMIKQLCQFYVDFSMFLSRLVEEDDAEKAVRIGLILAPLNVLQQEKLAPERDSLMVDMVNASQNGTACLVKHRQLSDILVRSLVDFVARQLLQSKDNFAVQLHAAAKLLLLECMSHPAISIGDKKRVTLQLAQAGQWDAWGVVYKANGDDIVETESLSVLKNVLVNALETDSHVAAFAAIVAAVNGSESGVVNRLLGSVGAELLNLVFYYGTSASTLRTERTKRLQCFADSMKVVLGLYQHILNESCLSEFLAIIFETFIAVLCFNGLPNHPSPQEKGEPALGRMVAQAVLHVARTSPEPFKSCMGSLMSVHDRTILEFSVRGEMTGYVQATQEQQPIKKKLDLKNFKR